ncbi:MAG TPA: HAD family hydrolase [Roseiflexaceae bacterium]|nr:HAD family hydrolase [Roseiflexaceae bacterium]
MLRAVIFDMGNTLIEFVRPGGRTWREFEERGIRSVFQYLIQQGHPLPDQEDAFVEVMFARLTEGWEQATGGQVNLRAADWIAQGVAHHALVLDDESMRVAVQHYARPLRAGVAATAGAVEVLAGLRARGLRVGLISNTIWPGELHLEDLAEVGVLPYVEHTIFSGDVGLWKPTPAIFTHMLDALGVGPDEAVFVGDSPREDIVGAQRVGMRGVLVRGLEFPLGDVRPDAIIETLHELPPLLERWSAK